MNKYAGCLMMVVVCLIATARLDAADIAWSVISPLSGPSDVSLNGTLLEALNFSGGLASNADNYDTTINGVTFQGFVNNREGNNFLASTFLNPTSTYFRSDSTRVTPSETDNYLVSSGGLPTFDELLSRRLFADGNTTTLSNLTVGVSYEVQLFMGGTEISDNRHIVLNDGTSEAFGSISTTNFGGDFNPGPEDPAPNPAGIAITGNFVADASTQGFRISNYQNGSVSNAAYFLNGYQLRQLAAPPVTSLDLSVNVTTGAVVLHNSSTGDIPLKFYEIQSDTSSMQQDQWNSISQQSLSGFPVGTGIGDGWEQAENSSNSQLGEVYAFGNSMLAAGAQIHLGSLFNEIAGARDLKLYYVKEGTPTVLEGNVNYVDGGLTGDYNSDGQVNLADYTVWRDTLGSTTDLAADGSGSGSIDTGDYQVWKTNFGNSTGAIIGESVAVPEPAAWLTVAMLLSLAIWRRGQLTVLAAIFASIFCSATDTASAADQPNIVFVMADDMGWVDTSVASTTLGYQSDFYETPALESLAAEGMSFNNAYSSGPNCVPTRSAILTGEYGPRPNNNLFTVGSLNKLGGQSVPLQGNASGSNLLAPGVTTIADVLKSAGYVTAHFGKYHVGDPDVNNGPLQQGFDFNYGGTDRGAGAGGGYHASLVNGSWRFPNYVSPELDAYADPYSQNYVDNNIVPHSTAGVNPSVLVNQPKHVTDALADAAIDFMNNNNSSPFFMHWSHHAVHNPTDTAQARDDLLAKYQAKALSNPSQMGHDVPSYAALAEGADQTVARLIDYLDSTPDPRNSGQMLSANTLVIFYSDNGGIEAPLGNTTNGVLRGQKGEIAEGGVRVPMIVRMPGVVPAGTVNDTPVTSVDFFTTWASMADATLPNPVSHPLDGADLSPIFEDPNASLARDSIFWHFPGYILTQGRDQRPQSAIRHDADGHQWKLYYGYESQEWDLFDLATDIGETTDLADSNPDIVDMLGGKLLDWLDETNAPLARVRNGSGPFILSVTGEAYSNDQVTQYNGSIVTISDGEEMPLFLGTAVEWIVGDLNQDLLVDAADWTKFRQNLYTDLSGRSISESILLGDLNQDLLVDIRDFVLFGTAYDNFNGAGAFDSLLAVPEPATYSMVLGLAVLGGCALAHRRKRIACG